MVFLATLAFAFLLTYALTPLAGRLGVRWGMVDRPGGRRKHSGIIPRTGGLALFGGFFVTVLLITILPEVLPNSPVNLLSGWFPARNDPNEMRRLVALLGGSLYCVVFGLLDDRLHFRAGPQYLIQFGAAVIGILGLIFIKHVNNPLGDLFGGSGLLFGEEGFPWWLLWIVTVFWYMGMMNTINFLDGASGLVAGVTAILSAVLASHMISARRAAAAQRCPAPARTDGHGPRLSALQLCARPPLHGQQRLLLPGLCHRLARHHWGRPSRHRAHGRCAASCRSRVAHVHPLAPRPAVRRGRP